MSCNKHKFVNLRLETKKGKMYIPFEQLDEQSRLWVYQSSKKLNEEEKALIASTLEEFCHKWAAHQQPLRCSFQIRDDRFVFLAVDESLHQASGCSIDNSVAIIRQLNLQLGIDLLSRQEIIYLKGDHQEIAALSNIKSLITLGTLDANTIIYNTLIAKKEDLLNFKISLKNSWLSRYLPKVISEKV